MPKRQLLRFDSKLCMGTSEFRFRAEFRAEYCPAVKAVKKGKRPLGHARVTEGSVRVRPRERGYEERDQGSFEETIIPRSHFAKFQ